MDNKLTDNEIIKALECCTNNEVSSCKEKDCPFRKFCQKDIDALEKASLDLINRQKAEIERLKNLKCLYAFDGEFKDCIKGDCFYRKKEDDVKFEAIKECICRLKQIERQNGEYGYITLEDIDKVKRELMKGDNEK